MSTKAERLLELFQGRTSEFAEGRAETDDRGRIKIAYHPAGRPLTLNDLERHIDGSGPVVGVYVLREDSHVKFASFDIDNQDLLAAEKLRRVASELGFPDAAMMIVDSGNKGYHLHFFFADWIPGRLARELLKKVCTAADIKEKDLELFPKQPELGQHSPYGNLIKLPLVVHPVSGRIAGIINARRVVPALKGAVEAIVGASVAPGGSEAPSAPPEASRAPVDASTAITEGGRNTWLTSMGGKLRRDGLAPVAIEQALLGLNQQCSPPLDDKEVRVIARSVSRYPAGEGDMRLQPPSSYVKTDGTAQLTAGEVAGIEMIGGARVYNLGEYQSGKAHAGTNWLIEEWLIRGQMFLTVGQEKLGKSTQAWHRIEAISTGQPYLGKFKAQQGRVLVMTEMSPDTIENLLSEDDIYPDLSLVSVLFLDEYDPRGRIKAITDAAAAKQPVYCLLDPLDECLGLDADGVWNPSSVANGIHALRDLMRSGLTVEGLFHYNKGGKVANSYKFTSSVDHIYELKGDKPSDLTLRYRGRTRAIPGVRQLTGSGNDGYEVRVLEGMPLGRPSKRQQSVSIWLADQPGAVTALAVAEGVGIDVEAAKQVLRRMVRRGTVTKPEEGLYILEPFRTPTPKTILKEGYKKESYKEVQEITYSPLSLPSILEGVRERYGSSSTVVLETGEIVKEPALA